MTLIRFVLHTELRNFQNFSNYPHGIGFFWETIVGATDVHRSSLIFTLFFFWTIMPKLPKLNARLTVACLRERKYLTPVNCGRDKLFVFHSYDFNCLLSRRYILNCTLQLKYTKVLSNHTSIIAELYGMASPNSWARNFKILLSELSPNLADTSARFLLNLLGWDNLSVRKVKQNANLTYKCINNLAPAYLCNLFALRTPNYYFRNAKKKLMLPKPKHKWPKA